MLKRTKNRSMPWIIIKTVSDVLAMAPLEAALSWIFYILEGLYPAALVLVTTNVLNSIEGYISQIVPLREVIRSAVMLGAVYFVEKALDIITGIVVNAGLYERCNIREKLVIYMKSTRLPFISYEDAEQIATRQRALNCVNREIPTQIYMTIVVVSVNLVSIVSVIGVLARYNIWFMVIAMGSVIPYLINRKLRGKEFYRLKKHQIQKERRLNYLWSLFSNTNSVKEMRVMDYGAYVRNQWKQCKNEINTELWHYGAKDSLSLMICDVIKTGGYILSIVFSLLLVIGNRITAGTFGACITAFQSVQDNMQLLLSQIGRMSELCAFAADYYEYDALPEEESGDAPFHPIREEIRLDSVSFRYPNSDRNAVEDIQLSIQAGEKVALVGDNGSGKTTLTRLLSGVYRQNQGRILFDGKRIEEFDRQSFRSQISVVSQDYGTYQMTLRENIAISDTDNLYNEEKMKDVIHRFALEDIVTDLGGLDAVLGREFGTVNPSGGQWQKIAIARGFFSDSSLMILDEPTSSLDPAIETEVLLSFLQNIKERTAIIVSHRVGLCQYVDKIVVMKDGRIQEVGSHADLMAKNGLYSQLYKAQQQWYV